MTMYRCIFTHLSNCQDGEFAASPKPGVLANPNSRRNLIDFEHLTGPRPVWRAACNWQGQPDACQEQFLRRPSVQEIKMKLRNVLIGISTAALVLITASASAQSLAPLNLGAAGEYVILSQTGITDVPKSAVTGNIGTSPISGAADLLTCTEVTGYVYSVDAAGPGPCSVMNPVGLTAAILDMQSAYTIAAGLPFPYATELGAGNIGGLTLVPGLYKWGTSVLIPADVTLSGGPNDVFIFQIAQNLTLANGIAVHLTGGVQAKNIFWQVSGQAVFGTTSHMEGIVLSKSLIAMQTGASINGRLYAQTAVTLQMNAVTQPPLTAVTNQR